MLFYDRIDVYEGIDVNKTRVLCICNTSNTRVLSPLVFFR